MIEQVGQFHGVGEMLGQGIEVDFEFWFGERNVILGQLETFYLMYL